MAEQEKKGTIYQQLNGLLNLDGFGFQDAQPTISQSTPSKETKIIIKGNTPEEIHKKGLELEQKKELQNKFFRTTDRGFQKALQYEAARLPAYIDYEGMEYYPIISSALDLFMEEATTIGMNGKMLNIYANKDRIRVLLEEFFYDIVNVNVNLPFWVRNTVKYGDNFVLTYGERKKGITHVKQLVNYEIERFERIQNGKPLVRFKERMTGDEFNIFEIAHFRLLGDDKYLPYGSCLLSDSYVKTNEGVKKIQDIVKGDKVFGFDVKTQEKTISNVLDVVCNGEKQTYKISTQHNFIKATDNHKILTYNDITNEFEYRFVSELNVNDKLIINNHDDYNEKIVINKTVEIKEYNNRIYGEFADDLKYVPDYVDEDFAKLFGFLLGDGNLRTERPHMVYFAYGSNNTVNEKYISLLRKFTGKDPRLAHSDKHANGIMSVISDSKALASVLTNMGFCGDSHTKRLPDWIYSCSIEIRKAFLEGFQDADGSTNIDKWNCKRNCIEISNYNMLSDLKTLIQSIGWKSGSINKRKERVNVIINGIKVINIADAFQLYYYESKNKQTKISDINNRLTNDFIIEKIKSIELDEIGLVYDIHVDNENHNFYANNIVVHNSVLNKVRRVFRQLVMAEDAMLTYRIIRAGEKKVYKIDVGNIDEDDIEEYIYKVATKFKKTSQVSPSDGQIDYRFNIMGNDEDIFLPMRNSNSQTGVDTLPGACLALNTKINLLDGRSLELSEIIKEYNLGNQLWSYSINPETGLLVPGQITWAGITRKNTNVLKITLDNGESLTVTPDHKFPTKFNGKKEAKDLVVGESMWAFNKKFEKIKSNTSKEKYGKDYEMIFDHSKNEWVFTHRMVNNFIKEHGANNDFVFDEKHKNDSKSITHHKSLNRYDNTPDNLLSMSYTDHLKYHSHIGLENMSKVDMEVRIKKLNDGFINYLNNLTEEQKVERSKNISKCRKEKLDSLTNEEYNKFVDDSTARLQTQDSRNKLRDIMQTPEYKEKMRINGKRIRDNVEINNRIKISQSFTYDNNLLDIVIEFVNNNGDRLESLVDYINSENNDFKTKFTELNKNKPFFKSFDRFTRKNILKLIRFYNYMDWKDFTEKIPCYNHKIVSIEFLPEKMDTGTITIDGNEEFHNYHNFALSCGIFTQNSNLDAIADIEYLRDNLFTGLGIPKPFLSFQDAAGGGKNMAQYDIRFSKKISRIQQAMIQELNKMAMTHLYLLGYDEEDYSSFQLTLTNPSTQQELLKSELMRDKAQTYTELTRGENGIAAMSHTNAKRQIFNWSDKQIVDDLKQQKMEKVVMQELADAPVLIKKSNLFADIDKRFGEPETALLGAPSGGTEQGMPPMGGGAPPPAPAGEMPPMGGGAPAGGGMPPMGGAPAGGGGLPPLAEVQARLSEEEFSKHIDKMVFGDNLAPAQMKENARQKIISENNEINEKLNNNANNMIVEIDELLIKSQKINKKQKLSEAEDIKFEDIEDI